MVHPNPLPHRGDITQGVRALDKSYSWAFGVTTPRRTFYKGPSPVLPAVCQMHDTISHTKIPVVGALASCEARVGFGVVTVTGCSKHI